MTKLSYANVKGFETRNSLIESYKRELSQQQSTSQSSSFEPNLEYEIEDEIWEKYYQAQKKLL